jgi:Fe-S oxidoreductase
MAKRLGADQAFVIYRRGLNEMPANEEEIRECQEEGIRIETLSHPIRILGENGKVSAIECVRMELGEKDADGRRQPIPVNGSEFIIEVDGVMPAIGQESEWSCLSPGCTCTLTEWGTMHIDSYTLQTDEPDIFAGGDAVTGPKTVVEAIEAGKQAAMSIDRYIQGVDLQAGRKLNRSANKETYWKETYWEDGIPHQPRTAMPKISPEERVDNFIEVETGYNTENAICEAGRCLQCECRICVKNCEFLAKNCTSPYELALKMKAGQFREHPETVYSCNLCGLCCQLCPNDLDIGTLCLQLREQLVEEGLGPLRGHAFVRKNQDYVLSESFSLVLPDKKSGRCEHVFFPGCNLPGYSPSLTLSTYKYLQEKQPDTGIVLGCCGVQTLHLGDRKKFKEIFGKTVDILKKTGAKEVIVACPECYETFKKNAPEINLTFISETLINVGLPDGVMGQGQTFSLHDSCATRDESELQENIRVLVRQLGYQIEEMKYSRAETSCCGLGGQAAFVDRKLVKTIVKNRIEQATHDLLTYCASCREAFADEKDTIHVLDLVFNSDWEKDKSKPTNTGKTRRENQARFKKMLE